MAGVVLAAVFDFVALAFGPQSVIAPIGSLTMIANACIAPRMHGEKLHSRIVIATVFIIIGCVISVASASHENHVCDIGVIFKLYTTPRFALYISVVSITIAAILVFVKRAERIKIELGAESSEYQRVFSGHRISYAAISGIFGAQSVLFARTVDLLFVGGSRSGVLFLTYPETYVILGCLVGCIGLQIYWLNQGLSRFESLYNVPIFTSTWIVGTVLGGGVFYGEFDEFTVVQWVLFPFGIAMCCMGVMCLISKSTREEPANVTIKDPKDEFGL